MAETRDGRDNGRRTDPHFDSRRLRLRLRQIRRLDCDSVRHSFFSPYITFKRNTVLTYSVARRNRDER